MRLPLTFVLHLALLVLSATVFGSTQRIDFNRDVRPILSNNCYFCHGPDVENNKSDLRLDLRDSAIEAGAIVPGDAEASKIVERIFTHDVDDVMPPPDSQKSLTQDQKDVLKSWIEQGAEYDIHWAYNKVREPALGSIDAIIRNHHRSRGLSYGPKAPATTLIRRVYLDTIGLPPTPAAVKAFLEDPSEEVYGELVDELLASEHYGENMAVGWLDAVRYADTIGYHSDEVVETTPFRDYVIHAFNTNKPYDEFVMEQLAGDLLPNASMEQRVGASYNRLNQISKEGGIQDKEYIKKYQAERVRTTATAFLGSTLACAECHDHKFDPFTTEDFYSFAAFFSDILEKGAWNHNGSYQVEDISKYLEDESVSVPKVRNSDLGPALEVPNRTFMRQPEKYEKVFNNRLKRLQHGTADSNDEFRGWLEAKEAMHQRGLQARYDLPDLGDAQSDYNLPEALDLADGVEFDLEVHSKAVEKRNLTGFGLLFTFENDQEYAAFWGRKMDLESEGRQLNRQGGLPPQDQWTELRFSVDPVRKQMEANGPIQSIRLISSRNEAGEPTNEIRNIKMITRRHQVPVGELSTDAVARLENYLSGDYSAEELEELRKSYMIHHAQSADLLPLRMAYESIDTFLNGSRNTPATISAKPREVKILPRGNWMDESGKVVQPATPTFMDLVIASEEDKRLTRLDLAKWVVDPDNPLTARTYMNRLWAKFFGTPLSNAPEDLGLQGEYPVYPDLLDYLAYEFMDSGWDIKHMVRLILTSEAYRQSSRPTEELVELDPYNRLLARQSPRRLRAENIRDNALAVSGLLVPRIGGASAKPYQPEGYYEHLNFPRRTYRPSSEENQYRRGLYTHWQRTFLHPMLVAFDAPGRDECAVSRPVSNTPLQALNQLNDPTYVEAALALANVLVADHPGDDASRLNYAFMKVLARAPKEREVDVLDQLLKHERERYAADPEAAESMTDVGLFEPSPNAPTVELAAWASVTRALLNLHETITRY